MKDLTVPEGLRKGQTLYLFLLWVAQNKKVPLMEMTMPLAGETSERAHFQLADVFNIPDHDLEAYWLEYMAANERKYVQSASE